MSKSYVDAILRVCRGILTDAMALDPVSRVGFEADYVRLESLASQNGLPFFTVTLPELDKALCQSLDHGFLDLKNLPFSRPVSKAVRVPRLLRATWSKLFDDSGLLRQDCDPTFVLILRSILLVAKKLEIDCSDTAKYNAVKEFFDVESTLPPAPSLWDGGEVVSVRDSIGSLMDLCAPIGSLGSRSSPDSNLLTLCQQVADMVAGSFGDYSPDDYRFKHGPGAAAEYGRGTSYKYSFPSWQPNLDLVYPLDMYGVSNSAILSTLSPHGPEEVEVPSRLIAVRKTQKAPRLIAAEPAANQWCQQNLLDFFVSGLRSGSAIPSDSVDFRRQALSGDLAIVASKTGRLATVDLKSASDRLTCWVVQRLWRANLPVLNAMVASRTRYMRQTLDRKQDSTCRLRKFATMGSALTFPVQSFAFFVMCVASGLATEGLACTTGTVRSLAKKVRVYGDDLICPVDWVDNLDKLMSRLFLRINRDKTFTGRNFRESCGKDGFMGYDVTPVKIRSFPERSKPSTLVSNVDTANLLHKKGLWNAAATLRSLGDRFGLPVAVVGQGSGTWGDETFCRNPPLPVKTRWNGDLQRAEGQVLQPKATRKALPRFEGVENLLQFFTEDPYDPTGRKSGKWSSGDVSSAEAGFGRRWVPLEALAGN